jgi:hypothetical protein
MNIRATVKKLLHHSICLSVISVAVLAAPLTVAGQQTIVPPYTTANPLGIAMEG